jgi:hypothetical protein
LFFIYTGLEMTSFEEIQSRLKQLLDKLMKVLHELYPENT